jgi:hypothetical protein
MSFSVRGCGLTGGGNEYSKRHMRFALFGVLLNLAGVVSALVPKKVHFAYPTELLSPALGSVFTANVTQDKLVCFGNEDYLAPTYLETLFCMLPYITSSQSASCYSVWGSRSVELEVSGHIEFLRLPRLPRETLSASMADPPPPVLHTIELSATRWVQFSTLHGESELHREIIQIPAEPIHLCARSVDWQGRDAYFTMKFRHAFLRVRDKRSSNDQTLLHILLTAAVTSTWFIPYLTAYMAARSAYEHGMKVMLTLFLISSSVVCLTPLMLTKHNRQLAKHYFNYFFTRMQAQDTRQQIKKRLPVFQALFFSSLVVVLGFTATYLVYYHGLLERESRNVSFKFILSVAISWFVFSLCRSFERFFRDWLWIAMSVSLANDLDPHLNPLCRNEVVFATMLMSQCVRLVVPRFGQFEFIKAMVSSALPKLQGVSARLQIPLPYQIYEHHSLRHLVESDFVSSMLSAGTSPYVPQHLAASSKLHSHMGTSTGDLSNLELQTMRRNSRSRAGLAQIVELPAAQPLVDYIDEVVEGSVGNETEGDIAELDLGEDMLGGEGSDQQGLGGPWGGAGVAGHAGRNSFSTLERVLGALFEEGSPRNADQSHVIEEHEGVRWSHAPSPRASAHRETETADWQLPLWQRLQRTGGCLSDDKPSDDAEGERPATVQEKNREALRAMGLDLAALPECDVDSEAAASSAIRPGNADHTVSMTPQAPSSAIRAPGWWGSVVGALSLPLCVVGPVEIMPREPATQNSGVARQLWLPIVAQDAGVVSALQQACSLVDGPVTVASQPALEPTIVFSAEVPASHAELQGLHDAMSGLCCDGACSYQVVPLHSGAADTAVVQLRVSTMGTQHTVTSLLRFGARALRRALVYSSLKPHSGILVNHQPLRDLVRLSPHMHFVSVSFAITCSEAETADKFLEAHTLCCAYERDVYITRAVQAVLLPLRAGCDVAGLLKCAMYELRSEPADSSALRVSTRVPVLLTEREWVRGHNTALGERRGAADAVAKCCFEMLTGQSGDSDGDRTGRSQVGTEATLGDNLAVLTALSYVAFLRMATNSPP